MNERIKELIKQAGGVRYDDDNNELTPMLVGKSLEKFAELLISSCANLVCWDEHITLPTEVGTTYHPITAHGYQLGKNLLTHFGIENE